jgi:hypothetical protein
MAAAAAACNLLLEFSQTRTALIQAGVLPALAPLVTSMLPELQLHAVWALKNLSFGWDAQLHAALLQVRAGVLASSRATASGACV